MSHARILDSHVLNLIEKDLGSLQILDVACGRGDWGFLLRTRRDGAPTLVGVDLHKPHLERLRTLRVYQHLVLADGRRLPFKTGVFRLVLACEVLEHLPKKHGATLLAELERVSRSRIIVTTPKGTHFQGPLEDNPFEEHQSMWQPEELENLGFFTRLAKSNLPGRTLKLIDRIRRILFKLQEPFTEMVAWKDITIDRS